jgi:hypothetical protein
VDFLVKYIIVLKIMWLNAYDGEREDSENPREIKAVQGRQGLNLVQSADFYIFTNNPFHSRK